MHVQCHRSVLVLHCSDVIHDVDVLYVCCCIGQPKLEGATALVFGGRRGNATCKHSQWVTDRVPIEEHRGQVEAVLGTTIQEVILSDATTGGDRLLLEGTVSNLFVGEICRLLSVDVVADRLTVYVWWTYSSVVRQDCVVTAQDDVLLGSTRELVLHACADLGIPVVLEPPKLSEAASWQAAFVTSESSELDVAMVFISDRSV